MCQAHSIYKKKSLNLVAWVLINQDYRNSIFLMAHYFFYEICIGSKNFYGNNKYFPDIRVSSTPRPLFKSKTRRSRADGQCPTEIYVRRQKRVHFLQQSFFTVAARCSLPRCCSLSCAPPLP